MTVAIRAVKRARATRTSTASRRGVSQGVTLLELMVVLAIVAIMLGIAVPSFLGMMQTNRIAGEVNSLVADLQLARGEAVKRGLNVVVCSLNAAGTGCSNANTWQTGWMVFVDSNASNTFATGEPILRQQKAWTNTDTFVATIGSTGVNQIVYNRDGFAVGLSGVATFTLHSTPTNTSATRCVAVTIAGRQTVQSASTGACR